MSSPAPEARLADLYGEALAALARDDLDGAAAAIHQADTLVSLAQSSAARPDLLALQRRLIDSATTMRDAVQEQQRQVALAQRTIRGYADTLADARSKLDAEA